MCAAPTNLAYAYMLWLLTSYRAFVKNNGFSIILYCTGIYLNINKLLQFLIVVINQDYLNINTNICIYILVKIVSYKIVNIFV